MECKICDKTFSSRFNLNRHIKQQHSMEQDYQSEDDAQVNASQQSDVDGENDTVAPFYRNQSGAGESSSDEEGDKVAPFYRKQDRETKARVKSDEKDNRDAMQYCHYMLQDTFGKDVVKKLFVNKSDEPYVLKRTREGVGELLETADKIRDSPVYRKIAEEQVRLEDCEHDGKEALKAAWFNRRFLVKNYLRKIIKEFEAEDEVEEKKPAEQATTKPAEVYRPMLTMGPSKLYIFEVRLHSCFAILCSL